MVCRECLIDGQGDFEMSDFAKRANVSVGLAYHHFGSKSGLIAACLDRYYQRLELVLNQPRRDSDSWVEDLRRRVLNALVELFSDPISPVVFGPMNATNEVAEAERSWRRNIHGALAGRLVVGQQEGHVSGDVDTRVAASMMQAGMFDAVAVLGDGSWDLNPNELAQHFWMLMVRALSLPTQDVVGAGS